jgi:hypothetical protein
MAVIYLTHSLHWAQISRPRLNQTFSREKTTAEGGSPPQEAKSGLLGDPGCATRFSIGGAQ